MKNLNKKQGIKYIGIINYLRLNNKNIYNNIIKANKN